MSKFTIKIIIIVDISKIITLKICQKINKKVTKSFAVSEEEMFMEGEFPITREWLYRMLCLRTGVCHHIDLGTCCRFANKDQSWRSTVRYHVSNITRR